MPLPNSAVDTRSLHEKRRKRVMLPGLKAHIPKTAGIYVREVPLDTHRSFKDACKRRKTSMNALLIRFMQVYVMEHEAGENDLAVEESVKQFERRKAKERKLKEAEGKRKRRARDAVYRGRKKWAKENAEMKVLMERLKVFAPEEKK